jgi:GrpB-like predicted nucleotidyltransferase (UPF0157 family)
MADQWLDVTGYETTHHDGRYLILKRGGKYVHAGVAPDEAVLTVIAETREYDEAMRVVRALRSTLALEAPDA